MDRGSVYSTHVFDPSVGQSSDTNIHTESQLETFILDFRLDNKFVYRYIQPNSISNGCDD
jgi:DNA replication licensing factor MCM5